MDTAAIATTSPATEALPIHPLAALFRALWSTVRDGDSIDAITVEQLMIKAGLVHMVEATEEDADRFGIVIGDNLVALTAAGRATMANRILSAEDRAEMFMHWIASAKLDGFHWPIDAKQQLVTHIAQLPVPAMEVEALRIRQAEEMNTRLRAAVMPPKGDQDVSTPPEASPVAG